ncbi:hypothetical protein GCM10017673_06020 [Streptosporangium violaceochromogenes]|nr:hypothetical protein GCM10017673_06020 [Streptosporangium violaceochromogenes]
MTPSEQYERFDHPVRTSRALHALGVCTVLVLPATGQPVLEARPPSGPLVRFTVVWRSGWVFTWRP